MNRHDSTRASDAKTYDRDDYAKEGGGSGPDGRISVNGSGIGRPRDSSPPKHILDHEADVAPQHSLKSESLNADSVDPDDSARAASKRVASERVLPHPSSQGTGVPDLGEANGGADSSLSQDANRRGRETDELSPQEKELRRPPSPFVLLDADPTRLEVPSDGHVVPVIKVGHRKTKPEPDK